MTSMFIRCSAWFGSVYVSVVITDFRRPDSRHHFLNNSQSSLVYKIGRFDIEHSGNRSVSITSASCQEGRRRRQPLFPPKTVLSSSETNLSLICSVCRLLAMLNPERRSSMEALSPIFDMMMASLSSDVEVVANDGK